MTHQLRVTSGPATGQVLPISAGYLYSVGRGADAQLSIPQDTTLSRAHAEIYFDQANNAWLLKNKSQHGTLLNGEVFNDHRYIQPGTGFQVGDSGIAFQLAGEAAPAASAAQPAAGVAGAPAGVAAASGGVPAAGAAQPAGAGAAQPAAAGAPGAQPAFGAPEAGAPAAQPGAEAVGAPVGAPAAGDGSKGADAGAAAGAAFGAAAGALGKLGAEGGSAVSIEHSGEGYPFKELVMGGLAIVRSNLIPSLALFAPFILGIILIIVLGALGLGSIAGIVGLLINLYMLALWLLVGPNYAVGLGEFQKSSTPLSIGTLIDFSNLPHKIKAAIAGWIGGWGIGLGSYALFIQLEHPNASPVDCIKLGYKFGIANLVPQIILGIVLGIVAWVSFMLLLVGGLIGVPTAFAAYYLAYTIKRNEILALAASEGINLG